MPVRQAEANRESRPAPASLYERQRAEAANASPSSADEGRDEAWPEGEAASSVGEWPNGVIALEEAKELA